MSYNQQEIKKSVTSCKITEIKFKTSCAS